MSAKIISEAQREAARRLASRGVPSDTIRRLIGPSPSGKLYSQARFLRLFRDDLSIGNAEADAAVAEALFELALSGKSVQATLAWAKQRLGWSQNLTGGEDDKTGFAPSDRLAQRQSPSAEALAALQALVEQVAERKSACASVSSEMVASGSA